MRAPYGELGSTGAFALDGVLDVVVADFADALVAPPTADLAVSLGDLAHAEVLRVPEHKDRFKRLWCEGEDVVCGVRCIPRTLRVPG